MVYRTGLFRDLGDLGRKLTDLKTLSASIVRSWFPQVGLKLSQLLTQSSCWGGCAKPVNVPQTKSCSAVSLSPSALPVAGETQRHARSEDPSLFPGERLAFATMQAAKAASSAEALCSCHVGRFISVADKWGQH